MFFLAFEGLDGSGKSSLMNQLQNHLTLHNKSFILTREPGGTRIGDRLRDIILSKGDEVPSPRTELLLYEASRSQHVDLVIKPALEQKQWVLCDRFTASSLAFQASGRQISEDQVNWLNNFATDSLKPDLNILLDLTVEESQKRRQKRSQEVGSEEDRMESEEESFHQRVRAGFLKQAVLFPAEWLVLDASKTQQELFQTLTTELQSRKWLE
jgi:dTMP kinase